MLTPQEVSTHAFAKAVMGGYNMTMVDEFLDQLTEDYTELYKENAALKTKIKVLVEKVEDYRATEDSMRATLLSAQKMADSIIREAETQRDEILTQAEAAGKERLIQLQEACRVAQERLRRGHTELAEFITTSREMCEKELRFLEQLPDLPLAETAPPAAEQKEPVRETSDQPQQQQPQQQSQQPRVDKEVIEIEGKVFAAFSDTGLAEGSVDISKEIPVDEETPILLDETAREKPAVEAAVDEISGSVDSIDDEPTRRIHHLEPLRFNRNYGEGGV